MLTDRYVSLYGTPQDIVAKDLLADFAVFLTLPRRKTGRILVYKIGIDKIRGQKGIIKNIDLDNLYWVLMIRGKRVSA